MNILHTAQQAQSVTSEHKWGTLAWLSSDQIGNTAKTAMAYVVICGGQANPRHRHNTCDELLYLISGKLTHSVGNQQYEISTGDTIAIPAGQFHNAINNGEEDAHMIVVYSTATRDFELESDELKATDNNA